jgi:hypothetical protein
VSEIQFHKKEIDMNIIVPEERFNQLCAGMIEAGLSKELNSILKSMAALRNEKDLSNQIEKARYLAHQQVEMRGRISIGIPSIFNKAESIEDILCFSTLFANGKSNSLESSKKYFLELADGCDSCQFINKCLAIRINE